MWMLIEMSFIQPTTPDPPQVGFWEYRAHSL